MKPTGEILDELLKVSPLLAEIGNNNVFEAPVGYFNTLNHRVLSKVAATEITGTIPAGYFNDLSHKILNRIKAENQESQNSAAEIKSISPALYDLQSKNAYRVPQGYFSNLATQILAKINKDRAKVIPLHRRTIWKQAIAAMITGVIAVNALSVFNKTNSGGYIAKENPAMPAYINQSYKFTSEDDVQEGIANLSDDEIVNYLDHTGTVADNEAISSSIDANELPSQNDYLSDENTLDNALSQLNKNNQ